jgi:hypothetical protein
MHPVGPHFSDAPHTVVQDRQVAGMARSLSQLASPPQSAIPGRHFDAEGATHPTASQSSPGGHAAPQVGPQPQLGSLKGTQLPPHRF